ncbi:hypothetical protein ACIP9H_25575 [Streptomyces sp. NPDC088732]|uniref:hypothetical protein n=1 Tax=Streptomyces sp. NPDC088732 TaxID=3365879 RepID=UPI00382F4381
MRISTLVRSSAALAALGPALGLTLAFYFFSTHDQVVYWPYPYAPILVQRSIEQMYALSYALVSAASAWQGARFKESRVQDSVPYRRTGTVIAWTLTPVVAIGWLVLLVPVALAFAERPTLPTPESLPPLLLGMALCAAHGVIGFAAGQWLKPALAVPVMACGVFLLVSYPHAMEPFYLRHMSGEYFAHLGFAETASAGSMVAHLLPTLAVAVAVSLAWAPGHALLRGVLAVALCGSATFVSYSIVKDWNYNPRVNVATVPTLCTGAAPEVCLPENARGEAKEIGAEVDRAFAVLVEYKVVDAPPKRLEEALDYGRFTPKDTKETGYLLLSTAKERNRVGAEIIDRYTTFPCEAPQPTLRRAVLLWLEKKTGTMSSYGQIAAGDPFYSPTQHHEVLRSVTEVSAKPKAEQVAWYKSISRTACEGAT